MLENAREITTAFWLIYGGVWLVTAFRLKPVARVADPRSRIWELLILICAAELLFGQAPRLASLDARWLPALPQLVGVGIALTAAGAAIGTAVALGEIRDVLALPLAVVGFWLKARSEERLLMSNFGDRYAAYRPEVRGAIFPYLL
jgi:hypothetical protein